MRAMASQITSLTIVYSTVSRLFTQRFIQAQIKENLKAPRHCPMCGKFTGDRWIPRTMASDAEMFPFDDRYVIMQGVLFKHG